MDWEDRWPEMFAECISCECPPGWAEIVDKTLTEMSKHPGTTVAQIKEKFGGLRLYFDVAEDAAPDLDELLRALVDRAESACWFVCQQCGTTKDVTTKGGWRQTLCGGCRQNLGREQNEDSSKSG